jgi:hypothetical protein
MNSVTLMTSQVSYPFYMAAGDPRGSAERLSYIGKKVWAGDGKKLYAGASRTVVPAVLTGALTFTVYDLAVQTLGAEPDANEY